MEVLIENRQRLVKINRRTLKSTIRKILDGLVSEPVELSVLLVDDAAIAEINEQYRHKQGPTNVISFAMREGEFGDLHPELLGDVVISLETALREAGEFNQSFEERLNFLLVHGILHLLGYDHERGEEDAATMERETERIMEALPRDP